MKRFFFTCKTLVFLVCFTGCYSEKILIITDIGLDVDDALAIHMIFTHEPSSVLAIACTGSRQPAGMVNELKCQYRSHPGYSSIKRIPVGSGSAFIDSVLFSGKRKHTVLLIAPAGDLAEAIKFHPDMEKRIKKIYFQGQILADSLPGKLCPNIAAYNVSENPAAARTVFSLQKRIPFVIVGKYAAYPLAVSRKDFEQNDSSGVPGWKYLHKAAVESMARFAREREDVFRRVYNVPDNQNAEQALDSLPVLSNPYDAVTWLTLICPQYFNPVISGKHRIIGNAPADSNIENAEALHNKIRTSGLSF
jgi:inosine-uridine nucleoside N-ribohydrolase